MNMRKRILKNIKIERIKEINKDVHIIAVSGYVDHETIQNCVEKKLIDERVFYKPIDIDDLVQYIKEL